MLPDVLADKLTVVFCGTAVGKKSAQVSAYYAGPGNKFWRMLLQIRLTPRQLRPDEYPDLPLFGVGLTDLVKTRSGSDVDLAKSDFGVPVFEEKIRRFAPKILCFNGKKAAKEFLARNDVEYGLLPEVLDQTQLFVAPSTSGAANGYWDAGHWHSLGDLCRANHRPQLAGDARDG